MTDDASEQRSALSDTSALDEDKNIDSGNQIQYHKVKVIVRPIYKVAAVAHSACLFRLQSTFSRNLVVQMVAAPPCMRASDAAGVGRVVRCFR